MGKQYLFRKNNSDFSQIKEFELRMLNLEAIITEMRNELEFLRSQVSEDDLLRVEQMQKYQAAIDQHFGFKTAI